jgi:hypothetical protein
MKIVPFTEANNHILPTTTFTTYPGMPVVVLAHQGGVIVRRVMQRGEQNGYVLVGGEAGRGIVIAASGSITFDLDNIGMHADTVFVEEVAPVRRFTC